jgi:hypothetical protein
MSLLHAHEAYTEDEPTSVAQFDNESGIRGDKFRDYIKQIYRHGHDGWKIFTSEVKQKHLPGVTKQPTDWDFMKQLSERALLTSTLINRFTSVHDKKQKDKMSEAETERSAVNVIHNVLDRIDTVSQSTGFHWTLEAVRNLRKILPAKSEPITESPPSNWLTDIHNLGKWMYSNADPNKKDSFTHKAVTASQLFLLNYLSQGHASTAITAAEALSRSMGTSTTEPPKPLLNFEWPTLNQLLLGVHTGTYEGGQYSSQHGISLPEKPVDRFLKAIKHEPLTMSQLLTSPKHWQSMFNLWQTDETKPSSEWFLTGTGDKDDQFSSPAPEEPEPENLPNGEEGVLQPYSDKAIINNFKAYWHSLPSTQDFSDKAITNKLKMYWESRKDYSDKAVANTIKEYWKSLTNTESFQIPPETNDDETESHFYGSQGKVENTKKEPEEPFSEHDHLERAPPELLPKLNSLPPNSHAASKVHEMFRSLPASYMVAHYAPIDFRSSTRLTSDLAKLMRRNYLEPYMVTNILKRLKRKRKRQVKRRATITSTIHDHVFRHSRKGGMITGNVKAVYAKHIDDPYDPEPLYGHKVSQHLFRLQ